MGLWWNNRRFMFPQLRLTLLANENAAGLAGTDMEVAARVSLLGAIFSSLRVFLQELVLSESERGRVIQVEIS